MYAPRWRSCLRRRQTRFRRAYCGLCHTLGERYGPAARMILNYDFTYLAILLSDPEEAAPCRRRCVSSPVRLRAYQPATAALELAADESVILPTGSCGTAWRTTASGRGWATGSPPPHCGAAIERLAAGPAGV